MMDAGYITRIEILAQSRHELIKEWRRHLHERPELSFEEFATAAFIAEKLEEMGCTVSKNIGGTGVVGLLDTKRPGPAIAFRADMDALPITENTGLPFASKRAGVMHACGHDAHMAIVLGLAKILSECVDDLKGTIKFIFQPGEEANGGARCMIGADALRNPDDEMIFALHMVPELDSGTIGVREGFMSATDDEVVIRVKGMSAHSSTPQEGVNAALIAAHIITALQSVQSTQISPYDIATFSVCTVKCGEAENIIPDYAELTGMLRCVEKKNKLIFRDSIQRICAGTAQALGGSAEAEFTEGFPAVFNDKKCTQLIRECAADLMESGSIIEISKPHMGSEDFSYYQEHIPGTIFMLGSKPKDHQTGPLHSPTFNICEDSLLLGVKIFASVAYKLCANVPVSKSK